MLKPNLEKKRENVLQNERQEKKYLKEFERKEKFRTSDKNDYRGTS